LTLPPRTVLLAAVLAAHSATLSAQQPAPDPTPEDVQRILRAQPPDPKACLALANRCWDPAVAEPLFECWLATASREDQIRQAASASWTVRGLALRALTQAPTSLISALRTSPGSAPLIEWSVGRILENSLAEILALEVSDFPAPNTISRETARQARDALWDLSDRNMTVALEAADRIKPISGRHISTGRFGESYDLASKDPRAYAARRRAWQLLACAVLAIVLAALRVVKAMRRVATALLVAVFLWAQWFSFQTDVRELPPPPLMFLTASFLAFVSAGLASGLTVRLRIPGWQRVAAAPLAAAAGAFLLCAATRAAGLFPSGNEGGQLFFEPTGSAVLAAAAALAISLGLALVASADSRLTSGAGAAGPQPSRHS
jgi:hypothetical protein